MPSERSVGDPAKAPFCWATLRGCIRRFLLSAGPALGKALRNPDRALRRARAVEQAGAGDARARVEAALRARESQLGLLSAIAASLGPSATVEQVIAQTLDRLRRDFEGVRVLYSTIDAAGRMTVVCSREPDGMPALTGLVTDATRAVDYRTVLEIREPVVAGDVTAEGMFGPLANHLSRAGSRAVLEAPCYLGDRLLGVLSLHAPEPREWTDGEVAALREVAHYLGVAIGKAEEFQQRRRAEQELAASQAQLRELARRLLSVREAEQARIAREVHDELGQALTALRMDLAWLTERMAPDRRRVKERVESMSALVDATILAVQRIASDLRPAVLDALGLRAAIEWQAREFEARTGIACRAALPAGALPIDRDHATACFRVLQEALTNVARHAAATRVRIRLRVTGPDLLLEVCDNGRGITEAQVAGPRALGIAGMRERALLLGGELGLRPRPGGGTALTLRIPLTPSPGGAGAGPV